MIFWLLEAGFAGEGEGISGAVKAAGCPESSPDSLLGYVEVD